MSEFYKIVCIGQSSAGKSCLVERFCIDTFNKEHNPTIGACMFVKEYSVMRDGEMIKLNLHLWEPAGQERFHSLMPMYLRNADVVLLVFDVVNLKNLDKLQKVWLPLAQKTVGDDVIYLAVGTKMDLLDEYELEDLKRRLKTLELPQQLQEVWYTSAKENRGIEELFHEIVHQIVNNKKFILGKREMEEAEQVTFFIKQPKESKLMRCCMK